MAAPAWVWGHLVVLISCATPTLLAQGRWPYRTLMHAHLEVPPHSNVCTAHRLHCLLPALAPLADGRMRLRVLGLPSSAARLKINYQEGRVTRLHDDALPCAQLNSSK